MTVTWEASIASEHLQTATTCPGSVRETYLRGYAHARYSKQPIPKLETLAQIDAHGLRDRCQCNLFFLALLVSRNSHRSDRGSRFDLCLWLLPAALLFSFCLPDSCRSA